MTEHSSGKLHALGLLSAGIAHDFNNLLSIIEGYSYILQQRIGNVPSLQDKLSAILEASHRGSELTGLLLEFGGDDPKAPSTCDMIQVIRKHKPVLRALLSSRIEIDFQLPPIQVIVDARQNDIVEQMVLLASKIGEKITGAGSITVTTNITHNEAVLFVTNNDTGLYVSKNFARKNALQDKTILVVDDEEALLPVLEHQLQNMGLKVLKAANADTALLLQKDYPDVIDFLLTDIVMPDVGGIELAELMADHRPRMGVVYMTGYTNILTPESSLVVSKPLRPETLSDALQKALETVTDA